MHTYTLLTFDVLDSTNDYVKRNLNALEDHTLVVAGVQTKGRGRRGRVWESAKHLNFLGSFYKTSESASSHRAMIDGVIAVVNTLESLGIDAVIKPPNDVYVDGMKIAGILVEIIHTHKRHVVIGIGLNVNEKKLSSAISLIDITQTPHALTRITKLLKTSLEEAESMNANKAFKSYIQKVPFHRIRAYNDKVDGTLESMNTKFECTVDNNKVLCDYLTFEFK